MKISNTCGGEGIKDQGIGYRQCLYQNLHGYKVISRPHVQGTTLFISCEVDFVKFKNMFEFSISTSS